MYFTIMNTLYFTIIDNLTLASQSIIVRVAEILVEEFSKTDGHDF